MPSMPTNNYISVVDKAMRVLEAFHGKREVALGEIASPTRLVKSSVFRILFTLERLGYVEKVNGGRYSAHSAVWPPCERGAAGFRSGSLAAPFMAELVQRFQETVNLGILDGGEVLYIHVHRMLARLSSGGPRGDARPGAFGSARQVFALPAAAQEVESDSEDSSSGAVNPPHHPGSVRFLPRAGKSSGAWIRYR